LQGLHADEERARARAEAEAASAVAHHAELLLRAERDTPSAHEIDALRVSAVAVTAVLQHCASVLQPTVPEAPGAAPRDGRARRSRSARTRETCALRCG
jgi:hypothetical protein